MGHRQQMNRRRLAEWDLMQYEKSKAARRGHNFSYLTDDAYAKLIDDGYEEFTFPNKRKSTHAESQAVAHVIELRANGYYARIFCLSNKLRIKEYCIWYKEKKK